MLSLTERSRQLSTSGLKAVIITIMLFISLSGYCQNFNENWEAGQLSANHWVKEGFSNIISIDYALSGSYSYKSALKTDIYTNPRSEIRFEGNKTVPKFQDQFTSWRISFSIYIPSDFKSDPIKESILQLKDIMDSCDQAGGNPPFKIGLEQRQLNATVRWTDQKCATSLGLKYYGDLMSIQPGKWHYFVLQVSWDYRKNGNGSIDLYASIDHPPTGNHKILTYSGPTGYNDNYGHYLKLGIYKWLWKRQGNVNKSRLAGVTERILYYDNIQIEKIRLESPSSKQQFNR